MSRSPSKSSAAKPAATRLPLPEVEYRPTFARERAALKRGVWPVAGCDEAGRGPLAGPVVAAAVILDPKRIPEGLDDSKRLSKEPSASCLFSGAKSWATVPLMISSMDSNGCSLRTVQSS